jgi:hypothetical protein
VLGILLGSLYVARYTLTTYARGFHARKQAVPERRLPPMILGAAILPLGLFLFAATASPGMNPWPQILSGIPIGAGIQIITLQSLAYVLDIYTTNANSAMSGTVIVRSLIGAAFPVVAMPMYQSLGVSTCRRISRSLSNLRKPDTNTTTLRLDGPLLWLLRSRPSSLLCLLFSTCMALEFARGAST